MVRERDAARRVVVERLARLDDPVSRSGSAGANSRQGQAARPRGRARLVCPRARRFELNYRRSSKTNTVRRSADEHKLLAQTPTAAHEEASKMTSTLQRWAARLMVLTAVAFAGTASAQLSAQGGGTCTECGVVKSVHLVEKKGGSSGVGAIAGGVLGGVVGHQFGSGRGNTAMTIAGAAG